MGQEGAKLLLIDCFVVSFFGRNAFHSQVLHNRVIQRLIAELLADLNHAGNLMRLAFANEVGNSSREDQNFKGSDAAFLVDTLEQVLSNDSLQSFGERRANFV